jgi:predicted dehydrogenase
VWRDFLDALESGGEPRVNGEEGLRVHHLIDALLASAASGAPVHVGAVERHRSMPASHRM